MSQMGDFYSQLNGKSSKIPWFQLPPIRYEWEFYIYISNYILFYPSTSAISIYQKNPWFPVKIFPTYTNPMRNITTKFLLEADAVNPVAGPKSDMANEVWNSLEISILAILYPSWMIFISVSYQFHISFISVSYQFHMSFIWVSYEFHIPSACNAVHLPSMSRPPHTETTDRVATEPTGTLKPLTSERTHPIHVLRA